MKEIMLHLLRIVVVLVVIALIFVAIGLMIEYAPWLIIVGLIGGLFALVAVCTMDGF